MKFLSLKMIQFDVDELPGHSRVAALLLSDA
jgi:hypothetical protein